MSTADNDLSPKARLAQWGGAWRFAGLAATRLSKAPIAAEAVKRIDALFAIEREINGLRPQERLCVRQERSRPLIIELHCANSVPGSLRTATRQKRSTTVSTAGTPSPASSMMGAFACRTTRQTARD